MTIRPDGGRVRSGATLVGNVPTDDLADWLEERFDARGERLLSDSGLDVELRKARLLLERRVTELADQCEAYEAEYEAAVRAGADTTDEAARAAYAEWAERARELYGRRTAAGEILTERLAAVLAVDELRHANRISTPTSAPREAVETRFANAETGLPALEEFGPLTDCMDAVREALGLEGDPLAPPQRDAFEDPPEPPPDPPEDLDLDLDDDFHIE